MGSPGRPVDAVNILPADDQPAVATLFFRIDMLLLQPLKGDMVVGYYGAAYAYINALIIIPLSLPCPYSHDEPFRRPGTAIR